MSNLISGKEALIALANGEEVEYFDTRDSFSSLGWGNAIGLGVNMFFSDLIKFQLKPKTITINGVEVPAPFEPKAGDTVFVPANFIEQGYIEYKFPMFHESVCQFGAWRNKDEIDQVVLALRSIGT